MSLGFDLNDLFEMSKVEENDQPIFISKTGEFNFMLNKPLEMTTKYNEKGVVYSEDGKTLKSCIPTRPGRIRIHEGVEQIGDSAFANCALSEIVMPDSIIAIGENAFSGSSLRHITFGNCIKRIGGTFEGSVEDKSAYDKWASETSYSGAFSLCFGLSSVVIPDNIETIGSNAFAGCSNLHTLVLSKNIRDIGYGAFSDCILENTVIPKSVTHIGDMAFYGASSLILEDIPKNFIKSVVEASDCDEDDEDDDYDYRKDGYDKISNYIEVSYNGNKLFIPRIISGFDVDDINNNFNHSWFSSKEGYTLFLHGIPGCFQQDTAFAEYQYRKTPEAFDLMKHECKEIAYRYLAEKNQERFVKFLETGAVDRKLLPDLLKEANLQEKTAAAAYIMQCLGCAPDNSDDDTFDI